MLTDDACYHIRSELKAGTTWLAVDDAGRRVVLKRLPPDCLRQGQLHPAVRDRLARFRELPLVSFAALITVERIGEEICTVSEYIEGAALDEVSVPARPRHLQSLRHTIAALHHLGLVHGQLHGRNIIVDPLGQLHVIDPSALLHDDPADDRAALDRLDPPPTSSVVVRADEDAPIRQRTLLTAVLLAAAGAIAALVLVIVFWGRV